MTSTKKPGRHGSQTSSEDAWPGWLRDDAGAMAALAGYTDLSRAARLIIETSPFLMKLLREDPGQLTAFAQSGPDALFAALLDDLQPLFDDEDVEQADVMTRLRQTREKVALLVAVADLAGRWDLDAVTAALTRFAEVAIDLALWTALRAPVRRGHLIPRALLPGEPADLPLRRRCGLTVLGMGKLGAAELNYSSDIDLILFFDEQTIGYEGPDDLLTCLVKATQAMVRILQERTGDGYVFRVDLRLRPDPGATPVAISIGAAEVYYHSMALSWERAAFIKARAVAGDLATGEAFLKSMRGFVWRRHLDYTAMRDIHAIKAEIHEFHGHADPDEPGYNVKLGRGGIREIEFFAQINQLIAGGRQSELRSRRTVETLQTLAALGTISTRRAGELAEAYSFLRMVEHRLQMVDDEQTQKLPTAKAALQDIAHLAGFDTPAELRAALKKRSKLVRAAYDSLLPDGGREATGDQLPQEPENLAHVLKARGFGDPSALCTVFETWRRGRYRALRTDRARELVETLLPRMLEAALQADDPAAPLMRFDELLSRLPAGVQLLSVFEANPQLLTLVFRILVAAPQLGEELAREPAQLDVLLDPTLMVPLPGMDILAPELEKRLESTDNIEECLDTVRRWTAEHRLKIGVQLLEQEQTRGDAGLHFTHLADCAVCAIKERVERVFAQDHGHIAGGSLAVVALGRYGGQALSIGSDLDLVFLFDGDMAAESDGRRPLSATAYYNRLAQRLVTALTAQTAAGSLYEVDTRLRPSGEQGLLAVTLPSFEAYQRTEAWTWEHMALTRARVVCADGSFRNRIESTLAAVLTSPRDPDKLKADVLAMRKDLRTHFPGKAPLDMKFCPGGMVDAEFMVQYLQLRHAQDHPTLLAGRLDASIRALGLAELLTAQQADALAQAYERLAGVQRLIRLSAPAAQSAADLPDGVQTALARALGVATFADVMAALDKARATISGLWPVVFG